MTFKMKNIFTLLLICILGGAFIPVNYLFAQTNKEIAKTVGEILNEESLEKTIIHHENIIAKYPEEVFIPNIMFELAELYVTKAEWEFKSKMKKYEEEIARFEKGELAIEPILPQIGYKNCIEICYKLLEKFPNTEYRDKVIYRLGMCHLDEGNQEKAKEYFQKLIYECAQSDKVSEAHFRLGEYYFARRDFHKAIEHYKELLDSWDDPFFNMSLYKLGWSYYNVNDYANSLSTYIYLISDIKLLEELDTELLGKTKADVKSEAVEYIAHSFTEYGGPELARSTLKAKSTQEYAILVLEKMGEIYKKRDFFPEAIATYEALLELYPFYPFAPNIQKQIIECYEKDLKEEKVFEAKETFIKNYGPESKWISQYPEGKIRTDALTLVQEKLFSLGTYYQKKAQEKNRKREYLLAIEKYQDYLKRFRDSSISYKVNYYLAECFYEIEDYSHAADEYHNTMKNYGDHEFKNGAAYNRILSYFQLLKIKSKQDSVAFYLEEFLGSNELPVPIKVAHENQANLLKACNDYVRFLPKDDKMLEVLMKYGEILYDLKKWDLAARVYNKVANDEEFKDSAFYGAALNMSAQCSFKMNNFDEAEAWYQKLAQAFPDSAKLIEKSKKMIATANYKKAEKIGGEGNSAKAALEFLKLAFSTSDEEVAKASIFEAAAGFEKAGEQEKAVKAYERMIEEQPNISFIDEVIMKAALLREKMGQWLKASDHYLKLVAVKPNSKFAPIALYSAASCFENMKLWFKTVETYQKYLDVYPDEDPDKFLEAQYKIGEISFDQMKDKNLALAAFEKAVTKYGEFARKGLSPDEYIAAKAQYMIAEINFEDYKNVKLIPPLQRSLQEKQKSLAKVLKAYIETGKYKVADWTTASLYKAGLTFEELCEAILTSPVPPDLPKEKVDEYYDTLNKQLVLPFKEKALEFYKSNVSNAEKNKINNKWTEESKKRMEVLIVELGLGGNRVPNENSQRKPTYVTGNANGGGS